MKLTYFSGDVPNFGDELNRIMWDAIIKPGFFDEDESSLFLGVGSILWDHLPKKPRKIVMGSGYGGYTAKPDLHDGSWDVAFVRGPRTASALNIDPSLAVTDSAILTHYMNLPSVTKKYKVSFMPHFTSISRGHWEQVCKQAGINYIDPTNPDVLDSLVQLKQTEFLITEAMHGAILADTLRVPWCALEPIQEVHRHKWYDWSESLQIPLQFKQMPSSSIRDLWAKKTGNQGAGKRSMQAAKLLSFTEPYFVNKAAGKLLELSKAPGHLSEDAIFYSKAELALDKLSKYCELNV